MKYLHRSYYYFEVQGMIMCLSITPYRPKIRFRGKKSASGFKVNLHFYSSLVKQILKFLCSYNPRSQVAA